VTVTSRDLPSRSIVTRRATTNLTRLEDLKGKAVGTLSGSVAQRLYAQQGGAAGSAAGGGQGSGAAGGDDNVVDAEFEEVKDDKKGNT